MTGTANTRPARRCDVFRRLPGAGHRHPRPGAAPFVAFEGVVIGEEGPAAGEVRRRP
jgi:hypothetical protein